MEKIITKRKEKEPANKIMQRTTLYLEEQNAAFGNFRLDRAYCLPNYQVRLVSSAGTSPD